MKTINFFIVIILLNFLFFYQRANAQLVIDNPSFEGPHPSAHHVPAPWGTCGLTPDTQPGCWGITMPPTNGGSYIGLTNDSNWTEGVSQQLSDSMIAGTEYNFTIDLTRPDSAGGGITGGDIELLIYGGNSLCSQTELLWNSGNVPLLSWTTYNVTFTPNGNYTHVFFLSHRLSGTIPYLLVDNICGCGPVGCFPFNTYQNQEICIITVDTASGKNMIIWEKTDSVGIESFNIYKQGSIAGVYDSIANIPFDSLSVFIDNTSNPAQHADLYKISVIDTCSFESDLSPVHKTIHLSVSGSMAQGFELIWDEYMGFAYGTYYIYRGTNNNLVLIDSVAANLHSWTDINPPSNNVYYQVAVFNPNPCNPTGGSKMIYNKSVSNIVDSESQGINEITDNGKFDIYPNPNKGTFHLNFYVEKPENIIIQIINDLGQNVYKQEHKKYKGNYNEEIDISSLKNGIYMLNIRVGENTYTRNISVMR